MYTGTEIYARHLPYIQDGMDLVISDAKGDGLGYTRIESAPARESVCACLNARESLRVLFVKRGERVCVCLYVCV